jgi:glycogen operon protein
VPLLLGGDELGRTQGGNNNAYCIDGALTWLDWASADAELLAFARHVVDLRRSHPVFRRRGWFGDLPSSDPAPEIAWLRPDGSPMQEADWTSGACAALGVFLNGDALPHPDARGERVRDASFAWLLNPGPEPVAFTLPAEPFGRAWTVELDTSESLQPESQTFGRGAKLEAAPCSCLLLRRVEP